MKIFPDNFYFQLVCVLDFFYLHVNELPLFNIKSLKGNHGMLVYDLSKNGFNKLYFLCRLFDISNFLNFVEVQ